MDKAIKPAKQELIKPKEEEEVKLDDDEYEMQFGDDDYYFRIKKNNMIEVKFLKRKYLIDNNDGTKSAQIIRQWLDYLSDILLFIQKKNSRPYEGFKNVFKYSHFTILEYQIMKLDCSQSKENVKKVDQEEICVICQCELFDDVEKMTMDQITKQIFSPTDDDCIQPSNCEGHFFHTGCLKNMVKNGFFKCPICTKVYGIQVGDQPDGTMSMNVSNTTICSGYTCPSIIITYNMPSGTRNGKGYSGTTRVAYLPDNQEGREVAALFKTAFDRKLIFTVGRSVTTGQDNQVVWNGIHHKTNTTGGSSHFGYPDPTYFSRVKQELAQKGVL